MASGFPSGGVHRWICARGNGLKTRKILALVCGFWWYDVHEVQRGELFLDFFGGGGEELGQLLDIGAYTSIASEISIMYFEADAIDGRSLLDKFLDGSLVMHQPPSLVQDLDAALASTNGGLHPGFECVRC